MKAVFDTNVVVAAFVSEGLCARLLTRASRRHFELCLCPVIIDETTKVLTKKIRLSIHEAREAISLLVQASTHGEPPGPVPAVKDVCRDPGDDRILACALAHDADYLVTGDNDLLFLRTFRGVRIITPRDFELLFGALDL